MMDVSHNNNTTKTNTMDFVKIEPMSEVEESIIIRKEPEEPIQDRINPNSEHNTCAMSSGTSQSTNKTNNETAAITSSESIMADSVKREPAEFSWESNDVINDTSHLGNGYLSTLTAENCEYDTEDSEIRAAKNVKTDKEKSLVLNNAEAESLQQQQPICPSDLPGQTTSEWKKDRSELKNRTKRKLADNAAEMRKTGGGCAKMTFLTMTELEVDEQLPLSANVLRPRSLQGVLQGSRNADSVDLSSSQPPISALPISSPILQASSLLTDSLSPQVPPFPQNAFRTQVVSLEQASPALDKHRKPEEDEYLTLLRKQNVLMTDICDSENKRASALERIANAMEQLTANRAEKQAAETLLDLFI